MQEFNDNNNSLLDWLNVLGTLIATLWLIFQWYTLTIFTVSLLMPSVFHTDNWRKCLKIIAVKRPVALIGFLLISLLSMVNRTLMCIEDILFRKLRTIEKEYFTKPGKIIFVLGHPRSGTTNLQKGVSSAEGCITGKVVDTIVPSLLLKYATKPFMAFVQLIISVSNFNQKNHPVSETEDLEEQTLLIHTFFSELLAYLFPCLSEVESMLLTAQEFEDWHLDFIKRGIARVIYFRRNAQTTTYVGCSTTLLADMPLLRKHFPHARFVMAVRDPR